MNDQNKIFKSYTGGKNGNGVYQNIINHIPKHDILIIGCLGNCGILQNIEKCEYVIAIDKDEAVINEWMKKFDPKRNIHYLVGDVITILPKIVARFVDKKIFVYLDPPYIFSSRKSDRDVYNYEMTDNDHFSLLKAIMDLKVNIAIRTYPNEMYAAFLMNWNMHKFQSMTRKGPATEYLYYNYPTPTELHDYRYIGKDFRERERITRKYKRIIANIKSLPVLERNRIIETLKGLS